MIPILMLTPMVVEAPAESPPLHALVETRAGEIHVKLIGSSAKPIDLRYSLTLVAGNNRTTQAGNAHLASDVPVTLLNLTQSTSGQWEGVLDFQIVNGRAYRIELGSGVLSTPH